MGVLDSAHVPYDWWKLETKTHCSYHKHVEPVAAVVAVAGAVVVDVEVVDVFADAGSLDVAAVAATAVAADVVVAAAVVAQVDAAHVASVDDEQLYSSPFVLSI